MDYYELWYRLNSNQKTQGTSPLTFNANGEPLKKWTIYGRTSPNIFDVSAVTAGVTLDENGNMIEQEGSSVSDFIPINESKGLCFSGYLQQGGTALSRMIWYTYYDDSKAKISTGGIGWTDSGDISYQFIGIPSTAMYIRIQYTTAQWQDIMLNAGSSVLPYEPYGSVGVETKNIFDSTHQERYRIGISGDNGNRGMVSYDSSAVYVIPIESNATYWAEIATRRPLRYFRLFFLNYNPPLAGQTAYDIVTLKNVVNPILTRENSNYPFLGVQIEGDYVDNYGTEGLMVYKGDSPIQYEPYGYKIPVTSGGVTTNIYLDHPLGDGESITMADTGIAIPTINGENILSVDTAVRPSNVSIAASRIPKNTEAYFRYKYDVLSVCCNLLKKAPTPDKQ